MQICYIDDFAIGSLARLLAQLPQPPVRGHDLIKTNNHRPPPKEA
jgi:hypothetical protein